MLAGAANGLDVAVGVFMLHPESLELQHSTDQQLLIPHKHQWSLVVQTAEFTGTGKSVCVCMCVHSLSNQNQKENVRTKVKQMNSPCKDLQYSVYSMYRTYSWNSAVIAIYTYITLYVIVYSLSNTILKSKRNLRQIILVHLNGFTF